MRDDSDFVYIIYVHIVYVYLLRSYDMGLI